MASGWSIKSWLFRDSEDLALSTQYVICLILGTSAYFLSFIIVGNSGGSLGTFVQIYSVFIIFFSIATVYFKRNDVYPTLVRIREIFFLKLNSSSLLTKLMIVVMTFYSIKVIIACLLGPIISGDALYFWISMAKVFSNLDTIPYEDPYHLWNFSAEPLTPSLYSWGLFIAGDSTIEAFRGIPILFFLAIPLLAHSIAKEFGLSSQVAQTSVIIIAFLPIMDYIIYVYSFYADSLAVVFVLSAIIIFTLGLRRGSSILGLIAGLAWSMAIMSKYVFGILAAAVIFVEIVAISDRFRRRKLFSTSILAILLISFVWLGDTMWTFLSLTNIAVLSPIAILCLVAWSRTEKYNSITFKKSGYALGFAALGAGTSFIWGIRNLINGSALFGINFLRLYPQPEEYLDVAEALSQVFPTASSAGSFTPITLVGFVFNPMLHGFFAVISLGIIALLFRRTNTQFHIWLLLFWYFGYITVMGYFPSGRHLLISSIILGVVIASGLNSLTQTNGGLEGNVEHILLLSLFCITGLLQFMTVSLLSGLIPVSLGVIQYIPFIPYTAYFGLHSTPELVYKLGLGAIVIGIITFLVLIPWKKMVPQSRQIQHQKTVVFVFIILSTGIIAPMMVNAISVTSGDLLQYDMKASWNQGDYLLAENLSHIVDEDDIILAFGDIVLSYMEFRIVDLYHGGLYYLSELVRSTNTTYIHEILWNKGIRFIILPSITSYLFSTYTRLIDNVPFPEAIVESSSVSFIMEMARWRVYELNAL
jgi:hypothetical protein